MIIVGFKYFLKGNNDRAKLAEHINISFPLRKRAIFKVKNNIKAHQLK